MHELTLWAGFLGAWLLVSGPVLQAVIELSEEDFSRERYQDAAAAVRPPERVSPWWWLLHPVRLYLSRSRHDRWEREYLAGLSDEQFESLTSYLAKARGWLLVAAGGLLIAAKETYELVEGHEWPTWSFWALVVVMALLAVGNATVQSARRRRDADRRRAGREA